MIFRDRATRRLAGSFAAAAVACLANAPALAEEGAAAVAVESAAAVAEESAPPADDPQQAPPGLAPASQVRISVGPEFVGGDGARYPIRTTVAGKGLSVAFSTTPAGGAFGGTLPAQWPLAAAHLTSGFGMRAHPLEGGQLFHSGVDLAAPTGTPIVATGDGTVGSAGWSGGYGLMVAIAHSGGVQTRYGHMSRLAVAPGQHVRQGEVIGYVGSTGRSTGPHLHYEIRVGGVAVNPLSR